MPFAPDIRVEALIRAARHCCVCHRYKGVKVEVHHIIQEADGGPNTLDNAIALCADCHTDAGHYNPKHPRGTKYSPAELRLARDRWHEAVRRGPLPDPAHADSFYCRYLLCKSFEAIHEVVGGTLSDFPFEAPLLVRTPVLDFLASIVKRQREQFRLPRQWGGSFQSEEEYVRTYPDAKKTEDTFAHGQKWLQYERIPALNELQETVGIKDYISARMLEAKLQPKEICRVRAFTDGCGDVLLQEEYRLRPFWVAYLVITNESGRRIRLVRLDTNIAGVGDPAPVVSVNGSQEEIPHTISFPTAEIPADATVVLPIATILGPIGEVSEESTWTNGKRVSSGQMQELSHGCFPSATIDDCLYWGPVLSSAQLRFMDDGIESTQEIHELDRGNLYVLDRYWMMGSCPHLFAIEGNGDVRYLGEIFTGHPSVSRVVSIAVEECINWLILAELEDERTFVRSVSQGDTILAEQVWLEKDDYIALPIAGTSPITLTGQYDLLSFQPAHAQKNFDRVRSLIRSFAGYLTEANVFDKHPVGSGLRHLTRACRRLPKQYGAWPHQLTNHQVKCSELSIAETRHPKRCGVLSGIKTRKRVYLETI